MPSIATDPSLIETNITSPTAQSSQARRASLKILSRNIDKVVLGNLVFPTWYYSPYPDSIVLGEDHVSSNLGVGPWSGVSGAGTNSRQVHGTNLNMSSNTATINGSREMTPTTRAASKPCEMLHVCPYCFRYTSKAGDYVQHLRRHGVTYDPYPATEEDVNQSETVEEDEVDDDASVWPVPSSAVKVYEWKGYTVWDVDGEREKLYCQNLSLFGKLFLEQKSVFFDTGGFHYFVLTYTPRKETSPPTKTSHRGRRRTSSSAAGPDRNRTVTMPADICLRTQVQGFFSKENLSWDANNLACILVFPPYQHRNLGQLLMAVSYKLSGWEWEDSIIGGPEKPLSTMGRRSYLRFWSERVARFMMGQTADADGRRLFVNTRKRKKAGYSKEEMTIREIGDRTGMLAEDVIAALQEMGVIDMVPPKRKKRKSEDEEPADDQVMSSMLVPRRKILDWVTATGVSLVSPVKEEGFLGEWALSEVEDEEESEEEEVEESEQ